jgi:hypothetical protein
LKKKNLAFLSQSREMIREIGAETGFRNRAAIALSRHGAAIF